MKKRYVFLLCAALFILGGIVGSWFFPHYKTAEYGQANTDGDTLYDVPEICRSESGILLDPYLEVTEDNVHRVLDAFFAAPTTVYFSFSGEDKPTPGGGSVDHTYKLRNEKKMQTFAEIFHDVDLTFLSDEEMINVRKSNDPESKQYFYSFYNILGHVSFLNYAGKTYIGIYPSRMFAYEDDDPDFWEKNPYSYSFAADGDYLSKVDHAFRSAKWKGKEISHEENMEVFE